MAYWHRPRQLECEWDKKYHTGIIIGIHKIYKKKKSKKEKDHHHEASTSTNHQQHESSSSSEQQPINIERESVLAGSSEQRQPLLWGGNKSDIPNIASPCYAVETESRVEKKTWFTKQTHSQQRRMNRLKPWMTREGEGDWISEYKEAVDKMIVNANQRQQPPISVPSLEDDWLEDLLDKLISMLLSAPQK